MNGPSDGGRSGETLPFPTIDNDDSTPRAIRNKDDYGDEKDKDVTPKKKPAHRRSISGNLLKLLRTGSSERVNEDGVSMEKGRSPIAGAMADTQRRKRKGSLRKSVLGKGREKERDRKGKSPLASPSISTAADTPFDSASTTQLSTPRPSLDSPSADSTSTSPEQTPLPSSNPPRWQAPFRTLSRVSIPSIRSSAPSLEPASSAASIHNTNTNPTNFSTSEDDNDSISLAPSSNGPRVPNNTLRKIPTASSIDSATSSSWIYPSVSVASLSTAPSLLSDTLRRSTHHLGYFSSNAAHAHARSPLASLPQSAAGSPSASDDEDAEDDTHDYALTAFWGYIILLTTYVVFVVGMGSCFGVWSWAWDVGETPYAPPELEDDASLPITGYYPALMVLTAVMAWVWVVVAWVGMKYFRHADF